MIRNVWPIPYHRGILGLSRWPVLTPRSPLFRFCPCPSWTVWRFNAREYWAAVTGRRGAWRGFEVDA